MRILDVHSHLGNILNLGGGSLIYQQGVVMPKMFDIQAVNEAGLMRTYGLGSIPYRITEYWATKAERARNFTATLENMQKSLDEAGVTYTVCLPIAPYVTFEDLAQAAEQEPRIIPFTSIDFTREHDIGTKLALDVKQGARGLKLHPIIQSISLQDSRVGEALGQFAKYQLPVLIHSGVSNYYLGKERTRNQPQFGQIRFHEELIKEFPEINFIMGHAGLFQVHEVCRRLKGCSNVWVDTSFQSPGVIKKLIRVFGPERVMYASDWPFGYRPPAIKTVKVACGDNRELEELIYYKNAAKLLKISE